MIQEGEPVEGRDVDRVFVAFEGGGAKGLVHIGALKALEEYGANITGLAGTSAGAIIAALRATGMHADDMADPVRGTTLLPLLGPKFRTATDIFGRGGWARIAALRSAAIAFSGRRRIASVSLLLLALFGSLFVAHDYGKWAVALAVAVWIIVGVTGGLWLLSGLSSVHTFRDALRKLLQERLFPTEPERDVLFSDFGVDGRPTLKIVATDLNARQLRLFSPEQTPDTLVADAVAASICLPVIFRPFEFGSSVFSGRWPRVEFASLALRRGACSRPRRPDDCRRDHRHNLECSGFSDRMARSCRENGHLRLLRFEQTGCRPARSGPDGNPAEGVGL